MTTENYDFDWLVIGSGFGGSVSALRLAEKGYSVGILESGKRFSDEDFPKSAWDLRRYFWAPRAGLKGILRLTLFKDILIASGSGVGGGSLGYASTLYVPPSEFFEDPQWAGIESSWQDSLREFYARAEKMLGVTTYEGQNDADRLLLQFGEEIGVEETYKNTRVGIYFGEAGETVSDPYFDGEGPERAGCIRCSGCMLGCRHNAKNTLMKNYLWFAERLGVKILPERTVTDIRPLGPSADGADGYEITSERSGAWFRRRRKVQRARGVVLAAGALGTNSLLASCKLNGSMPAISDRLGHLVRTNSEAILAVTARDESHDFLNSVAISSSIYPDHNTHIETVTYGPNGDAMSFLFSLLTGDGSRITRPLKFLGQVLRHPADFVRTLWPHRWSRRTMFLLVMQTLDSSIRLIPRRGRFGSKTIRLQTKQDPENPNPTYIPVANQAAQSIANAIDGIPLSGTTEVLFNIPSTAHILGGAVIGRDRDSGVVDGNHRVFGYENFLVCDGSVIPANVGVNPSLTITALTERAISKLPLKRSSGETVAPASVS